ncbi:MAG: Phosphoribosyltransferase [Microgenomates group bacterium GW2011_GWC1_43_13]|nr:MAG: Phosphoribosyltransferase [Microgenomates group bacterium GW2011_GWC1_43_13]
MVEQDKRYKEYPYKEKVGIRPVSWEVFHRLCKGLVQNIAKYDPDVIVGNGRGGLMAATLVSHMLQKDLFPIRISRRENNVIKHERPVWSVLPAKDLKRKKVLVVDEICDTGETLNMITAKCWEMKPADVKTAVLYSRVKGQGIPDYIGVITEELIVNIWDSEIFDQAAKKFKFHPDYITGFQMQSLEIDDAFQLKIKPIKIAKGQVENK